MEPKCPLKVRYLNNCLFPFSIRFFSIMKRCSRNCFVVTHHDKLIANLSEKDCALRDAWDILNGGLKGLTQAENK